MDHAILVLCALLLNAALAGPRAWYAALGISRLGLLPARLLRLAERKLNRERRSPKDREMRGWLLTGATALAGIVIGSLAYWFLHDNLRFFELLLVAALLPVRPTWDRLSDIRTALAQNNIAEARLTLFGTAWKHHAMLDEPGLGRAAIETTAIDFSEKIAAPVLGYLLFGLPGLLAVKCLTMAQGVLTHTPDFGKSARAVHDVLHYIPSRLSAGLWALTPLFLPSGNMRQTAALIFPGLITDTPRAFTLRAASAVTRVSLGGPGSPYAPAWTAGGTMKPLPADLKRAQAAFVFMNIFLFVFIGVFF